MENKDSLIECLRNAKVLCIYFLNAGFLTNSKYAALGRGSPYGK